jgi:protein-tyrosine phosphatase
VNRHIHFDRLHNFRDVGGYRTVDGQTVAWQRLYRSDSLGKLAGPDWSRFQDLRVRTVIDLRYPWEIAAGGRVPSPDAFDYHHLSIEKQPYDQASLDPSIDPVLTFAAKNIEVAHEGAVEIRAALDVIATVGTAPVVVHCSAGKDRTGLIVALVLGLLGVSDDDIVADYALTGIATARLIADYRAAGKPPVRWPGYGHAPAEAMRLTLRELSSTYGSLRGYAAATLDVDDTLIAALRQQLLEPAVTSRRDSAA